jgi:hypothetical protein
MYIMENNATRGGLGLYRSLLAVRLALAAEQRPTGSSWKSSSRRGSRWESGPASLPSSRGYSFALWFIYGFLLGGITLLHSIFIRSRLQTEHGF